MARLSWEQRRLDRQLAQLKAAHAQLTAEETRLRTDPAYVEGLIRTTFKYAKPGEFVIPLDGDSAIGTSRQP
jgi:cell division protein FtsB